jgi:hypothetical protein
MIGPLKSKEPHLRSFFSSAGDMVPAAGDFFFLSLTDMWGPGLHLIFIYGPSYRAGPGSWGGPKDRPLSYFFMIKILKLHFHALGEIHFKLKSQSDKITLSNK